MTAPKSYQDGLTALLGQYSTKKIALVKIDSSTIPDYQDTWFNRIIGDLEIPRNRIFGYVPPYEATHNPARGCRQENTPKLKNPNLIYVIVDDVIETKLTLECAIKALENQGVERGNLWFLVGRIKNGLMFSEGYLDTIEVFLKIPSPISSQ